MNALSLSPLSGEEILEDRSVSSVVVAAVFEVR